VNGLVFKGILHAEGEENDGKEYEIILPLERVNSSFKVTEDDIISSPIPTTEGTVYFQAKTDDTITPGKTGLTITVNAKDVGIDSKGYLKVKIEIK